MLDWIRELATELPRDTNSGESTDPWDVPDSDVESSTPVCIDLSWTKEEICEALEKAMKEMRVEAE